MRILLAHYAAAAGTSQAPSFINSPMIQGAIGFVVTLVLSFVAIKVWTRSDKGDVKGATNTGIVVFIGCVIFALAMGGLWMSIGSGVLGTLFNA